MGISGISGQIAGHRPCCIKNTTRACKGRISRTSGHPRRTGGVFLATFSHNKDLLALLAIKFRHIARRTGSTHFAHLEFSECLGDRQSCGAYGGKQTADQTDDQSDLYALHQQLGRDGEVKNDLAEAIAVERRNAKPVENNICQRAAEQPTDQGQQC